MATIGVQLMMVRDKIAAEGLAPVLERLAALGYEAVEVSQVPTDAASIDALDAARRQLGLQVAALSVGLKKGPFTTGDALDTDLDKIVADCRRLDCRYVRIGMMPFEAMVSTEALTAFALDAEAAAQTLAASGITLAYHTHHVEFARYDGETAFQILGRLAPTLRFEIDVHWVQRAGCDPLAVLRDLTGRVPLVHLKDYRVTTLDASALDLLTRGDVGGFMTAFTGLAQFAELGAGNLDIGAIAAQALDSGAEFLIVEQDELYGRDAYDCLADSIAHLRALGY